MKPLGKILQNVVKCCMLNAYLISAEGGNYVNDERVSYTRGGGRETQIPSRVRPQIAKRGQASWTQVPGSMAHQCKETRRLDKGTRTKRNQRGLEVSLIGFWVAHSPPITYQGVKQRVVSVLLAAYFTTLRNALQHQTTQSNALHG